jgi:hypothetical protein
MARRPAGYFEFVTKPIALVLLIMAIASAGAQAAVSTYFSGTMTMQLTVNIVSSIPASTPVQCTLFVGVVGGASNGHSDNMQETATVTATRTGSTAVCMIILPYQWALFGSADTVDVSFSVSAGGRYSSQTVDMIGVPANGKTTNFKYTTRI